MQFLLRRTTKDMPGAVAERDIAFSAPMSARELKSEPFQSLNIARMRTGEGKAKRKVVERKPS